MKYEIQPSGRSYNHTVGSSLAVLHTNGQPFPLLVTIRDNKDHIRVLLYSYYNTIPGFGALLSNTAITTRILDQGAFRRVAPHGPAALTPTFAVKV